MSRAPMVVAHNGNLVNAEELKEELELKGAIFHTNSDAEIIAHVVTEAAWPPTPLKRGASWPWTGSKAPIPG